ncbi:MAG TPA: hypothetical protein VI980_06995 [Acidimicrobiia bacterium]|nr:hypothetical protein [Acidimicrobiia bacterium]
MTESRVQSELVGLLVQTARDHHAATGGPDTRWAEWYAERLINDVNRVLDTEMSAPELAEWLASADRRYVAEQPQESWPTAYAQWLLADQG